MYTYSIELNNEDLQSPEKMKEFQDMMDAIHTANMDYIAEQMKELNVSFACANDVVYLRSRSRWTQEIEDELIRLHKEGNPPDINEFGFATS